VTYGPTQPTHSETVKSLRLLLLLVGSLAAPCGAFAQPASSAAAPAQQLVPATGPLTITIYDEQIDAGVTAVRDGQVFLSADLPRSVPLEELSSIRFRGHTSIRVEWLGQDNHDLAQVGKEAGPNGIQDIHMRMYGLDPSRKIKQLVVAGDPYPREIFAYDSSIPCWKLVLDWPDDSTVADIYVDPVEYDPFELPYDVTIAFEDGEEVHTRFQSTTHTSNKTMVDPAKPPPPAASLADDAVEVHLVDGGLFRGQVVAITGDEALLKPTFGGEVRVPLMRLRGLRFLAASKATAAAREQCFARLAAPDVQDVALVLAEDQTVTPLAGTVEGLGDGRLLFVYEGKRRSLNIARLAGLVLAKQPRGEDVPRPLQVFELAGGERLFGAWTGYSAETIQLEASWGGAVALPSAVVSRIGFRNGRMIFLSDLEPAAVEESAWFGRVLPWRKDQGLLGGPLAVRGQTFNKGLAMHSRYVLTYALDGRYESLQTVIGFEESALGLGRAACRVLGDGRELFAEPDLQGDADPRPLKLDVTGIKMLTLEVDFGEAEDVGDRVVWGNARLFKVPEQAPD